MVARPFRHEAENRQLSFDVQVDPNLGRSIVTDSKRLQQVLKNLLSNAFKFTAQGGVRLNVSAAVGGWSAEHPVLNQAPAVVVVRGRRYRHRHSGREAEDHLRGVPAGRRQHQPQIWRHRAWASPSAASCPTCWAARSSCAARPASGSTFTLYLPLRYVGPSTAVRAAAETPARAAPAASFASRRRNARSSSFRTTALAIQPGDVILLIVEDDPHYARIMIDLARDNGFKTCWRCAATMRSSSPSNISRPRSRSTCSCPTCWAGTC